MILSKYVNDISHRKSENFKLEKNVSENLEPLGNGYKNLGDLYINYFKELFITHKEINQSLVDLSFSNYKNASDLFLKNKLDVKYIYSLMAWGNAYKESFLPSMKKNDFSLVYNKAKEKYNKGIDHYFAKDKSFPKEYHFLMLEQFNLEIRKMVWENDLLPKRVNIFHSLKSPISRAALDGLYYYSFLKKLEIWEYSFGGVETFDETEGYIRNRLNETSAVIFLLSEDYTTERDIVNFELDRVYEMVKKNDPIQVFVVNLGNQALVKKLSKDIKDSKTYEFEDIPKIFEENSIKDIYECQE